MKRKALLVGLLAIAVMIAVAAGEAKAGPTVPTAAPTNPIAWWPGDGDSSDISGNGHDALSGQGDYGFGPGKVDQAFRLDGIDDYVAFGTGPVVIGAGSFSVDGWIKTTDGDGMILQQRDATQFGYLGEYYIGIGPGIGGAAGQLCWATYGIGQAQGFGITQCAPGRLDDGYWHHIAAVQEVDGTGPDYARLYIDGVLAASQEILDVKVLNPLGVFMGADMRDAVLVVPPQGKYLQALLDEFTIVPAALSAPEIQAIHAAGSTGKRKPGTPPDWTPTVEYVASGEIYSNPERGFYRHLQRNPYDYTALNADYLRSLTELNNISLVSRIFYLEEFRSPSGVTPLSQAYLDLVQDDLETIREAGLKAIVRFAYTADSDPEFIPPHGDGSKDEIMAHLAQLAPILEANSDVIAIVQAGFIGIWGEWAYTDYFVEDPANPGEVSDFYYGERGQVLSAVLSVVPPDRMVQIRTPLNKQKIYGTSSGITGGLTAERAFDGSHIARTGHHNDCFLASSTDYGTYVNLVEDMAYLEVETRYLPMGGETCIPLEGARTDCTSALAELERFHWSYINLDWYPDVITGWSTGGCLDEIKRHLGYRFTLIAGNYPSAINAGGVLPVRIRLRNDGWAAPFNPRPVELVLRHTTTGQTYPFDLPVDPRYWLADGDATHVINHDVLTPSDLPSGGYEMLLNLPDPAPLLYGISAYSIRFANAGVWEDITGFNNLLHTVTVVSTNRAPFLTTDNDGVTVDEGRPATNTGTVGDDDDDQVTLSASVGTAINNGDGTWSWSFPTTDGPTESQTVTISADDGKGGTAQAIFALAVNNVAPTVETIALPVVPVAIKDQTSFNIDVTFRDPAGAADEPYTCDFDLDNDGTVDQTVSNVAGATCNTPLAYAGPGVYTVKVTVTDINGGSGSKTATEFVVIYDPEGGFVTGGGWIISLAAACPDFCGGATGKANFGFVSKYKKGASTPTGETEFQFKAGNLRFRSDSYDWLVVAGPTAKYKGQGTVNGRGDFGFMLTATDEELTPSADVDLFRIKIWDMDTDAVIYDNQWGEGDDSNAGTAIQGGSIVVHKPK